MADISSYLEAILEAVYGEDVRGSIHDAIDIINQVGEKVLSIGTAVTATTSSTQGYFENSLYVNNSTWDVWKCTGSAWAKQGNIKGAKGDKGDKGNTGTTPNISASASVSNTTGTPSVTVTKSGTTEAPSLAFAFTNLKGAKGDTGATGPTGNGIASIAKTSTVGKVDTYTITMTDGTTYTFTVTNGSDAIYDALGLSVVDGKLCMTYEI